MICRFVLSFVLCLVAAARPSMQAPADTSLAARVDYLAFARGAMPVRVSGNATQLDVGEEQALRAVDGSGASFVLASGGKASTVAEFVYELPVPTTFDRFAVPNVIDAPGPAATFVKEIEVLGSSVSPDAGFVALASATLTAHARRGEATELAVLEPRAVRWVRLRLSGGLDMANGTATIEFTELIGNGTQESAPLIYRFRGDWTGNGSISLRQQGAVVSGCFDTVGELVGTVSGTVLSAVGTNRTDKVRSSFVLGVAADGTLRGLRATGAAGFRPYRATRQMPGLPARCTPAPVKLACGATLHAISFAPGTAVMSADAMTALTALAEGLQADPSRVITIEAHLASSDAPAVEAQALSLQYAQGAVAALTQRGLAPERLRAIGAGSGRPLVTGDDETARSINRRLEIRCQ